MLKDIKKRSYMWWKLNAAKQNCFFYFRYNYKYFKEFPRIIFHFNKTFQSSWNHLLNHEIVFIYNVHIYENLESGFKTTDSSFENLWNYSLSFSIVILENFIACSSERSNLHSVLVNNSFPSTFFYSTYHILEILKIHDKKCNLFQESHNPIHSICFYLICLWSIYLGICVDGRVQSSYL